MGVGAGVYMYDVVVKKLTIAISSPDEFSFAHEMAPFSEFWTVILGDNYISVTCSNFWGIRSSFPVIYGPGTRQRQLLQTNNREWYVAYRIAPFPTTILEN